ncbi:hypothetical protein ABIA39_001799 [Nocardia sp. GAS34]|uniref:DUF5994 family protein n=1 Tax=unclassified Nocardia TaxID=2637762 RepID=UPI003D1F3C63
MTLQHTPNTHVPPAPNLRVRLRRESPAHSHVDGAWWPYRNDLAAELPELLEHLSPRLGPIERVLFHLDEWSKTPAKLSFGERRVRLDGYRHHKPAHTILVRGVDGRTIGLLVIPPTTGSDTATAIMAGVTHSDDTSTVEDLLIVNTRDRRARTDRETAEQRWDNEGGATD